MNYFVSQWPWKIFNLLPEKKQIEKLKKKIQPLPRTLEFDFSAPKNPWFLLPNSTWETLSFFPLLNLFPKATYWGNPKTFPWLQALFPDANFFENPSPFLYANSDFENWKLELQRKAPDILFILPKEVDWTYELGIGYQQCPVRLNPSNPNCKWLNLELSSKTSSNFCEYISKILGMAYKKPLIHFGKTNNPEAYSAVYVKGDPQNPLEEDFDKITPLDLQRWK